MAIKPILFNTEMVRAVLDGRKICTRRLAKFLPGENPQWTGYIIDGLMFYNGKNEPCIRKAPYQPGDILYVRETWGYPIALNSDKQYVFRADEVAESGFKNDSHIWHPSIHMPKEAARIWLKVTGVRAERLQEITEEQASAEGTNPWDEACYENNRWHPTLSDPDSGGEPNMVDGFHKLWNSTIKKSDIDRYGWDVNPWVWVVEFERCEKPELN